MEDRIYTFKKASAQAPAAVAVPDEDMQDLMSKALRKAWQLGQTYWQQADSEFISQQKKSDATQAKFQDLIDETRAALAATPALPATEDSSAGDPYGVAEPSDKELIEFAVAEEFILYCSEDEFVDIARSVLRRFGNKAGQSKTEVQAEPVAIGYPHEQMDALALARYKVVPSDQSMYWRHAVVAGEGLQHLYNGSEVDCQNMARKFAGAFLDGAFTFHPRYTAPQAQPADAFMKKE